MTGAAPYQVMVCGSTETQQCLLLLFMAFQLKAIGGTDYTVNGITWSQLQQDAQSLEIGESEDQLMAGTINYRLLQARAAGANVPALPDTLTGQLQLLGQLVNTDPLIRDKMQLLLLAKLGVAKAYPQ